MGGRLGDAGAGDRPLLWQKLPSEPDVSRTAGCRSKAVLHGMSLSSPASLSTFTVQP